MRLVGLVYFPLMLLNVFVSEIFFLPKNSLNQPPLDAALNSSGYFSLKSLLPSHSAAILAHFSFVYFLFKENPNSSSHPLSREILYARLHLKLNSERVLYFFASSLQFSFVQNVLPLLVVDLGKNSSIHPFLIEKI